MEPKRMTLGAVLIALGVVLIVGQRMGVGGEGAVAAAGIAFLVAYALTRHYGFLVPGGIMTGLGIGIIYENRTQGQGVPVLLGLGLGFLSIYLIDAAGRRTARGWWPLIPGGVLTLIGLLQAAGRTGVLGDISRWWPVVLIAIGAYLLLRPRGGQPPKG